MGEGAEKEAGAEAEGRPLQRDPLTPSLLTYSTLVGGVLWVLNPLPSCLPPRGHLKGQGQQHVHRKAAT